MTAAAILVIVALLLFALGRLVTRLVAIGDRRRSTPLEVWRVALEPPIHIVGLRTWSPAGMELVMIAMASIVTDAHGERLSIVQEVVALPTEQASAVRDVVVTALFDRLAMHQRSSGSIN